MVKGTILHRTGCERPRKRAPVVDESPAVQLGRRGGQARAKNLSAERRSEIAKAAIRARWDRVKEAKEAIG